MEEGAVAFVADGDVGDEGGPEFEVGTDVGEFDAEGGGESVASAFSALEAKPGSARGRIGARTGVRVDGEGSGGWLEGAVEAGAELGGVECAGAGLVPLVEPSAAEAGEFLGREGGIAVGIAGLEEDWGDEEAGAEVAGWGSDLGAGQAWVGLGGAAGGGGGGYGGWLWGGVGGGEVRLG